MSQFYSRIVLPLCSAAFVICGLASCGHKPGNNAIDDDTVVYNAADEEGVETIVDPVNIDYSEEDEPVLTREQLSQVYYRQKYDEVCNCGNRLLWSNGKKIWYTPRTSATESGYDNKLYVYDSETDSESVVNLNKTSMEDEGMDVEDMTERNGIITIIMTENRNSNGWVEGTYVWQYNCNTGSWKALAKACSGAEFINNGSAVKINNAECLNPDDPTYLQKYRSHYKTIRL